MALCLIAFAACMIAGVSSWLNVAGIAGNSAVANHLNTAIAKFEVAVDDKQQTLVRLEGFKADFEQAASLFRTRQESEIKAGAYTGAPGTGTVEQTLGTMSDRFVEYGAALATSVTARRNHADAAQQALVALRHTANGGGDPKERLQAFAEHADGLRASLVAMDARPVVDSLVRGLRALPGEARLQVVSAKTKAGAERQRAALARIAEETEQTVELLASDLNALLDEDDEGVPGFAPIDPIEAVLSYPLQNAPYWVGGLAMDFAPTLVLIYAMVIMHVRGRGGIFTDRLLGLTVEDLLLAKEGERTVRSGFVDPDLEMRLQQELTGSPQGLEYMPEADIQAAQDSEKEGR